MKIGLTQRANSAFESLVQSHVGAVRPVNEDRVLAMAHIGLWAIADGMGGHKAGDLAAETIVNHLNGVTACANEPLINQVQRRVAEANENLLGVASSTGASVIGSTVVVLLIQEDRYTCTWAGDSRAYLYRSGRLTQLTRDHSLVQELVDSGRLTQSEARRHPKANVLTRAVGVQAELELDVVQGCTTAGDLFLLCSDGLSGFVTDQEIAECLAMRSLTEASERMMELTFRRGAKDNVTFAIVRNPGQNLRQWVEHETYVGRDRRRRRLMRLLERRRSFEALAEPPSLRALLRQLRSASLNLEGEVKFQRFLLRLDAAIETANIQAAGECSTVLLKLKSLMDQDERPLPGAEVIEAHLVHADRLLA